MATRFHLVHAVAEDAHGLVTRSQLIELGVSARTVARWITAGLLHPMGRGTYRVMGAPATWEARVQAACLERGGIASHRTAAVLHGAPGFRRTSPEIVVPHRTHASPRPLVHRTRNMDDLDVRKIAGIPTVGPGPLLLQLATLVPERVPIHRFDDAVEHLVRSSGVTWTELDRIVELGGARRSRGVRHLRAIVREYLDDGCESRLERDYLDMVRRCGLPLPVAQHEITLRCGRVVRVDFAHPPEMIATELDSLRFHRMDDVTFTADREKRRLLRAEGWQVDEITARMLRLDGDGVMRHLEESLRRRRFVQRAG